MKPGTARAFASRRRAPMRAPGPESLSLGSLGVATRIQDRNQMKDEIPQLLDSLAERFCERRALKPLWRFLSAYFSINGLTDGWEQCYDALRDVRSLCGGDLLPDEFKDLNLLINRIGQMLDKQAFIEDLQNDIMQGIERGIKEKSPNDT